MTEEKHRFYDYTIAITMKPTYIKEGDFCFYLGLKYNSRKEIFAFKS